MALPVGGAGKDHVNMRYHGTNRCRRRGAGARQSHRCIREATNRSRSSPWVIAAALTASLAAIEHYRTTTGTYNGTIPEELKTMPKSHAIRPTRSLPTTQARTELPNLVKELVAVDEAGASLVEHAVEIGPRNRGGVWLMPAVDAQAAIDREQELQARIEELEDEAENVALGLMLVQRLEQSAGTTTSGADFIRELGFDELAADLPE
jgi:hypothetical protein